MSHGGDSIENRQEAVDRPHMGRLLRELIAAGKSFSGRERNCCFLNTGQAKFANVSAITGLDLADDGRAIARIDWDADGDLDFWVVNRSGPQLRYLRNDYQGTNNYVAFKLIGVDSNRDAIGARVSLARGDDGSPQQRTVVAGSGYLSQSSRWIHFGLGDQPESGAFQIAWPSGFTQQLDSVAANQRYTVTEGKPPVVVPVVERSDIETEHRLTSKEPPHTSSEDSATESSAVQVLLTTPTPTPALIMESRDKKQVVVPGASGDAEATLLVLWSQQCRPCLVELSELASSYSELQSQGVRVMAASIDRCESSSESSGRPQVEGVTLPAPEAYPFAVGWATADLLDNLQLTQNRLFGLHDRLQLPCSFLLDRDGKLVAIYRGSVRVDRLLVDAKAGRLSAVERRAHALPFAGRWSAGVRAPRLLITALGMLAQGDRNEAQEFYQQHLAELRGDFQYHILPYNLAQQYTRRGEHRAALKLYEEALRAAPDLADAHYNLGLTHAALGNKRRAITHLRRAAELEPNNAQARVQLAKLLLRSGQVTAAAGPLREALRIQPDNPAALYESALLAALSGDATGAQALYRRAAAAAPDQYATPRRRGQLAEAVRIGSQLRGEGANSR